jgi:hypothetical protein
LWRKALKIMKRAERAKDIIMIYHTCLCNFKNAFLDCCWRLTWSLTLKFMELVEIWTSWPDTTLNLKKKKSIPPQAVVTSFAQLSHDNGTHNGQDKQSKQSLCARVKLESDEA